MKHWIDPLDEVSCGIMLDTDEAASHSGELDADAIRSLLDVVTCADCARNLRARICEGCGGLVGIHGSPCMSCVRARHKAVLRGRCVCRKKHPGERVSTANRSWVPCCACLGAIRGTERDIPLRYAR